MPNLDEIKARRGKIMQGEWVFAKQPIWRFAHPSLKHIAVPRYVDKSFPNHEVTDFIANAPTDIDWLVGEVERLRTEVSALTYADEFTYT